MKYRRLKLDRRGDISSPIIVILVTVAALAVAGMAIAWMASTGSRASSQGSLIVVGTPTVTPTATTSTLYITIKNIGNADATISSIRVGNSTVYGTYSGTISVPAGSYYSTPISLTMTGGTFSSSNTYPGTIVSSVGTILFSALCQ
jgi:hypothetical protein